MVHMFYYSIETKKDSYKLSSILSYSFKKSQLKKKLFYCFWDDDVHFMGFSPLWSRPDWMICQVLPIAPPSVRPSVKHNAILNKELK